MNVPEVQAQIRALPAAPAAIEAACELIALLADLPAPADIDTDEDGWVNVLLAEQKDRVGHPCFFVTADGRVFADSSFCTVAEAAGRFRVPQDEQ